MDPPSRGRFRRHRGYGGQVGGTRVVPTDFARRVRLRTFFVSSRRYAATTRATLLSFGCSDGDEVELTAVQLF